MRSVAVAVVVAVAACRGPAPQATPPAPTTSTERGPSAPTEAECASDQDCVLMPWITCCGECEPAPPFEVGTRTALDGILIESEFMCARYPRPCVAPVCAVVPAECEARATCRDGRCAVESTGCDLPTS